MSGTGGGYFDPVSGGLAYVDYGETPRNLYRLGDALGAAVHVGELKCAEATLAFINRSDGLALCTQNFSTWDMKRTTDGGRTWQAILPNTTKIP